MVTVANDHGDEPPIVSGTWALSMVAAYAFFMILDHLAPSKLDNGSTFAIVLGVICILMVGLQVGVTILGRRATARDFWRKYS
jgi:hypothetical protein